MKDKKVIIQPWFKQGFSLIPLNVGESTQITD